MDEKKKKIVNPLVVAMVILMICLLGHLKLKGSDLNTESVVGSDHQSTYEMAEPNDDTSVTIIKHIEVE